MPFNSRGLSGESNASISAVLEYALSTSTETSACLENDEATYEYMIL